MCHLNAAVLIKSIPGAMLEFLILRKDSAEDDLIAVKPVTNFPAVIDQIDQLHSCYKNVRNVAIQKVVHGRIVPITIIIARTSSKRKQALICSRQSYKCADTNGNVSLIALVFTRLTCERNESKSSYRCQWNSYGSSPLPLLSSTLHHHIYVIRVGTRAENKI